MSGQGGFTDGMTVVFFCFRLTVTLCLVFQSVRPLWSPCSFIQCHSACSVSLEQDLHGPYFTTPSLLSLASPLFCAYVYFLCISCHMEKFLLCFICSSLVGWFVCSLATSESRQASEDGMFQVFLEHILVTCYSASEAQTQHVLSMCSAVSQMSLPLQKM